MSFRSFSLAAFSLLVFAYLLTLFTNGFEIDDSATLSVLITYLKTGVIVTSFLLGRYIFSLDNEVFSKIFFIGMLAFTALTLMFLAYNANVNYGYPYAVVSDTLIYFYMYIFLPILIAKPSRFLLRVTSKISKPF